MQKMVKGANVGLAALSEDVGSVMMSLGWSSLTGEGDADVSVLLLDGNGKVRSDADFCFYNNPIAGNGSVQLLGKTPTADGNEDRISFDLDAVPPEVEQIVVAASRYGGSRFGDLNDLHLTLADSSGESLVQFSIEDAGAVSAFIFGELYRRTGEWKFRAVGQGYESGLGGLATDFGVDIDDDAGEEEQRESPRTGLNSRSGRTVPSGGRPRAASPGAAPVPDGVAATAPSAKKRVQAPYSQEEGHTPEDCEEVTRRERLLAYGPAVSPLCAQERPRA